jgi:predicted DNA-binding transcriptional regulator
MDKKVHILYPLIKSSVGDCEELKYSLRSLETHLTIPFDVTIIGYKPKWLNISKVRYIYYGQCDDRYKNSLHAIDIMANIVDEFILFNDDFFIISDMTDKELKQIYYLQDLNKIKSWGKRWYQQMLKKGFEEIKAKGYYGFSYATHAPQFYKSEIVKKVIYDEFKLFEKEHFVAFENYYYNFIGAEKNAKQIYDYRVARYDKTPFKESEVIGKIFMNFDENGMNSGIWDYVKKRFNMKSKFEI